MTNSAGQTLNGSNSSTTSSVASNAATNNLVASNPVMASLSSLSKSSGSPIVSQHPIKYEDQLNYASLTHSQSTHSQLNAHPTGPPAVHLQENGPTHLLSNGDSLAAQNPYHTMNQLSSSGSMGFHQLNTNVYAAGKPHLSPANGFLANSYNQFNHSGQINSTPGYDFWNLNYDGYSNGYNFCSP